MEFESIDVLRRLSGTPPRPSIGSGSCQCSRCTQGLEQNVAITRLGPSNVLQMSPEHKSYHWFLDCSSSEHETVAVTLIKDAQSDETGQNWHNLRLNGALLMRVALPARCADLTAAHLASAH
jgi:hypothetical protein